MGKRKPPVKIKKHRSTPNERLNIAGNLTVFYARRKTFAQLPE
jgi:hypothetical protein